jgi:hypothetical protein
MIFFPNQTAEMLMDFNYLEITFKSGTCNSPNKIVKPNYCVRCNMGIR